LNGSQRDSQFRLQPQSRKGAEVVWLEENIRLRLRLIHHGFQLVGGSGDLAFDLACPG